MDRAMSVRGLRASTDGASFHGMGETRPLSRAASALNARLAYQLGMPSCCGLLANVFVVERGASRCRADARPNLDGDLLQSRPLDRRQEFQRRRSLATFLEVGQHVGDGRRERPPAVRSRQS